MSNIFQAIVNNLKANLARYNTWSKVGLNPVRVKLLKLNANDRSTKEHKFEGGTLTYNSSYELLHGIEEIFIDEIYKCRLQEKPYILDCGANIGLSVLYYKKLYPQAKVVAFEPDDTNFELLKKNVAAFDLKQVELKKEAVWTKNETLYFESGDSLSGKLSLEGGGKTYPVPAIRLKEYLNEPVDMLKMDVEGAEYEVLKDIKENLSFVKQFFIEYHGKFNEQGKLQEMLQILTESGFTYYIKEAFEVYKTPFYMDSKYRAYDVQLNIFCFRL